VVCLASSLIGTCSSMSICASMLPRPFPWFMPWACLVTCSADCPLDRSTYYTGHVSCLSRHMASSSGITLVPAVRARLPNLPRCSITLLFGSLVLFAPHLLTGLGLLQASSPSTSTFRSSWLGHHTGLQRCLPPTPCGPCASARVQEGAATQALYCQIGLQYPSSGPLFLCQGFTCVSPAQ
jgi:hypothetical protein